MADKISTIVRRVAAKLQRQVFVRCMRAMPRTVLACMRLRARFLPRNLNIYSVAGGLGDELMIWGVLQTFAACRPAARVTFHSRFAEVLKRASSTIHVVPYDAGTLPKGSTGLGYVGRTQQSINEQMAARLGLVPDTYPIPLPSFPASTPGGGYPRAGTIIVIQPVASAWTPNKQWPQAYWTKLVESLPADATVVELGQSAFFTTPPRHPHYVSLAGSTSISDYIAAISHASVFVGPPSSGMHVAHAYGIPSVIMVGGYEAPVYPYPRAIQLHTEMPCSPCWLCTACPHDRACLRKITPEVALDAVLTQLETVRRSAQAHA